MLGRPVGKFVALPMVGCARFWHRFLAASISNVFVPRMGNLERHGLIPDLRKGGWRGWPGGSACPHVRRHRMVDSCLQGCLNLEAGNYTGTGSQAKKAEIGNPDPINSVSR